MKTKFNKGVKNVLLVATLVTGMSASAQKSGAKMPKIKNVVLVHGAFADGSGYKGLYEELSKEGYYVTVVQNPLTSLEDDVKATMIALDKQDGPTILVGHSYGGAVITEAGNHPKVVALVYVAAFQPDAGESALDLIKSVPAAPESGILPPDEKGIVYNDRAKFHAGFCADLSEQEANFMAASQGAFYAKSFTATITKPAWKNKPVYAIVATEDKTISPITQRTMYKRSNSKVTEIKGSHVVFISQPKAVAKIIMEASKEVNVK